MQTAITLKNKTVLITGATAGIGKACAGYFAKAQARIIITGRRIERLRYIAENLKNTLGATVHYVQLDISKKEEVARAMKDLPREWQEIDILVNNAGLSLSKEKFHEGAIDDWEQMIHTNLNGLIYVTRHILPGMVKRNSGHIINIGSISGHDIYTGGNIYCATKHAVTALGRALRMDLFKTKVRVSNVDPGAVVTEFSLVRNKGDAKKAQAFYQGFEPLVAEDIADAVLYCATRPLRVDVSEILVMPTDQPAIDMIPSLRT